MPEIPKNIPDFDASNVLAPYKSHPVGDEAMTPRGPLIRNTPENMSEKKRDVWTLPHCETPFEKKMYILHECMRAFDMMIYGLIRLAKIGAWCIAIVGSLFVALLATNTMDQATDILNKNILSKWGKSIEIPAENSTQTRENTTELKSSTLTTPAEMPDVIAQKRAALIEARKAARLQQENLATLEKGLTQ